MSIFLLTIFDLLDLADIGAFDFFRQETSHADISVRSDAMSKLLIIAALMNADKVRSDMIPYLICKELRKFSLSCIPHSLMILFLFYHFIAKLKDSDQILLAMAGKIGSILQFMGGPEYSPALIPIFESLCETEESTIRFATTMSIKKVLSHFPSSGTSMQPQIQPYIEFFKRICQDDNPDVFYPRVSAGQILPDIYRITADSDRTAIRELMNRLAKDEYTLVRQSVVGSIAETGDNSSTGSVSTEVYP